MEERPWTLTNLTTVCSWILCFHAFFSPFWGHSFLLGRHHYVLDTLGKKDPTARERGEALPCADWRHSVSLCSFVVLRFGAIVLGLASCPCPRSNCGRCFRDDRLYPIEAAQLSGLLGSLNRCRFDGCGVCSLQVVTSLDDSVSTTINLIRTNRKATHRVANGQPRIL